MAFAVNQNKNCMKKSAIILCLLFTATFAKAQFTSASLTASGLTCSMCSKAVYSALVKVSSVETVKSNIAASSYRIVFKKDAQVNLDDIKNAVKGAGFSVAKLQVTMNFNNVAVENDAHVNVSGENLHFLNVSQRTLNGEITLTVLDKDFISTKEYKKFAQYTSMKCYTTGFMDSCCKKDEASATRIYHVTI